MDKMFLMIPEFKVDRYDMRKAREDYAKMNAIFNSILSSYSNSQLADDITTEEPNDFKIWFEENKDKYIYDIPKVRKVKYDMSKSAQDQTGNTSLRRAKRNNMLIDIAFSILTHPDTAEKILNPGNFDKAKVASRIANIISSPQLTNAFADYYGTYNKDGVDLDAVGDILLRLSKEGKLDEIDDFIKKHKTERSQLTIDTFIYNHKQNMTGDALIGMYANNTSMQAKYQNTSLSIASDYVFTINGRQVQSLHDIISPLGERISKNCANFSAASVDNVKDPVLADLMQNIQTANIAGFMLRAGMSIEEIGLLFSQPIIRRCITETGGLMKLQGYIDSLINALKNNKGGYDAKILSHNFTSKELIMNALNEYKVDFMTQDELNNHLASQIQAGLLMSHIAKIALDLSDLTQISRADSPNASIDISIAGAKNQIQKVNLYTARSKGKNFTLSGVSDSFHNNYIGVNTPVDVMREKLMKSNMPMLQAFYSLGIELATQVLGDYFSQVTPYTDNLTQVLYDNSKKGIVNTSILNKFYSELVEFALSRTQLLGDDGSYTFDEKRDYYLLDFPRDYLSVLASNPDIASMSIFKKIKVQNGDIVMPRSSRLTPKMRDTLMRDFDMLMYMDNPAAQKLAVDLFLYSYYKNGLKYGPNSFGTFFSSNFISTMFPEFISTLRELKYNMKEGSYFDNFLPQFYANHFNEGILPEFSEGDESGNKGITVYSGGIAVKSSMVQNKHLLNTNINKSYPLIVHDGTLFSLAQEGSDVVLYTSVPTFDASIKGKRGVKYNANQTFDEMLNYKPDSKRIEANANINPTGFNAQVEFDESQLSALEDSFNGFAGIEDAVAGLEERYNEDSGNAQLDTPLC